MSINITSDDVKVIDINGYYIRIIPSLNQISENIIQALGICWTTLDGLAGVYWTKVDGVTLNFHSFNQLIQMCKIKDVAIPATLHKYIYPLTIKHDDLQKETTIMTTNQLINIQQQTIGNDTVNAVSARELHKFLESKRQFTNWVAPYVSEDNDYGFVQDTDFIRIDAGVNPTNGVPLIDYWFTIDMAKEVSMLSKTAKGKEARKYFIECEKKANNPIAALPNFADPAEAAIAWANEYKEKEKLHLEMKQIETQIAEDKPYTKLGKIMTMVDATIKIGEYAIMLQNEHKIKIGQNRLFEWLRERGYLCKEEHQKNRPTQKSMELGLFAWTERVITTNHGDELISFTPRITGKGQAYFIDKLIKDFSPKAA